MTTRKEFQEWLNRFPEDTIINIGMAEDRSHSMQTYTSYTHEDFLLEDTDYGRCFTYNDWTLNNFVKPDDELFGKRILNLGDKL
jgi:predicted SAM-dependent methyltransferase